MDTRKHRSSGRAFGKADQGTEKAKPSASSVESRCSAAARRPVTLSSAASAEKHVTTRSLPRSTCTRGIGKSSVVSAVRRSFSPAVRSMAEKSPPSTDMMQNIMGRRNESRKADSSRLEASGTGSTR